MSRVVELRVQVGTLRVLGASTVEARNVADALPEALQHALTRWPSPPSHVDRSTGHAVDRVAERVAERVAGEIAAQIHRRVNSTSERPDSTAVLR
jgi:hypothetical protein